MDGLNRQPVSLTIRLSNEHSSPNPFNPFIILSHITCIRSKPFNMFYFLHLLEFSASHQIHYKKQRSSEGGFIIFLLLGSIRVVNELN